MSLETPTPDGVLDLFREEIVPREAGAEVEGAYDAIVKAHDAPAWANPFPGVETLEAPGGPILMRITYSRRLDGAFDEGDRIRHELRQLWNDIRAAIPSGTQAELLRPRLTHVDRPDGLQVTCYTRGIARPS